MRGVTERERRRDRQSGRGTPLVPTVFSAEWSAEGHQNGVRAALLTDAPLISQECTGGSPERGRSSFNLGSELPRFDSSSTSTRRDYFPMPASLRPHSPSMRTRLARGGAQVGRHTGRTPILWLISGETPPNPASPHRSFSPPKIAWVARPNIQGPGSVVDMSRQKTTSRPPPSMGLVEQGLAHRALPSDLLSLSLTSRPPPRPPAFV